jgi:hypothetical protein
MAHCGGLGSRASCRAPDCRTKHGWMLLSNNNRIQFELRGVWSDGKISSLVVHSVALVRHSNRLVPFFRKCQKSGGGVFAHPSLRSGCLASLGQARCDLSCVRPERTNGVTPYGGHDHVRVSLTANPGRKRYRSARKERSKIEDRTSIGTRTRTHPFRVCVRSSALSFSLR